MNSFPKSEYWHFKISWKHCQENFQFSRRDFFGLQDFDISTRSYLTSCRDSRRGFGYLDFGISRRSYLKSCRDSRRVFGRQDFEISSRSRRESRQDFEISVRISASFWPPRFWDLAKISLRIILDEILRSHQDLGENLGEFLAAEILRSRQSRRPKTRRDSRRDLGQNFAGVRVATGFFVFQQFTLGLLALIQKILFMPLFELIESFTGHL